LAPPPVGALDRRLCDSAAFAPPEPNAIVTPARGLVERARPREELFLRLTTRIPADAFARFMTDAGTVADELASIRALPPLPTARTASIALGADTFRAVMAVSRDGPR
jgi:hypothetical protein